MDFSSAFNTILLIILADKLEKEFLLIDFLWSRTQLVRMVTQLSDKLTISTGSHQGFVLSPLLFILYTKSCNSTFQNRLFINYADDTALESLVHDGEDGPVLEYFIKWCERANLVLNTTKTKCQ